MDKTVGIVGLGIMGGVFARFLAQADWRVVGHDIDPVCRETAAGAGVDVVSSAAAVAAKARVIITMLPSAKALHAVIAEIAGSGAPPCTVVDMGTLSLADKQKAQQTLADAGHSMLDCPVSGTGTQAKNKDIIIFVSGDPVVGANLEPMFAAFAREAHHVGPFGCGTRMKFVANLLVSIHTAAAGEAFALGIKAGLDPKQILQLMTAGAANSRMLQVRGPMMAEGRYDGPNISARATILAKDTTLIGQFADDLGCPVPLLGVAKALFVTACATGHADEDAAAVCAVSEQMAGSPRFAGDGERSPASQPGRE